MKPYARYYPPDPEGGSAMVEFVIVFPMWVLMTLGIMQLALMHAASNIVQVSSFAGARSATVFHDSDLKDVDPKVPPVMINIPITGNSLPFGIGTMPTISKPSTMSGTFDYILALVSRQFTQMLLPKTKVTYFNQAPSGSADPTSVEAKDLKEKVFAQSKLDFELVIPVVNMTFVHFLNFKQGRIVADSIGGVHSGALHTDLLSLMSTNTNSLVASTFYQVPHAVIRERSLIFRPWANNTDYQEEGAGEGSSGSGS